MQLMVVVVVSKTYVAVFACWNPSAGITLHHRRIATPVLEKYYLLSALKGLLHLCQQRRREWLLHHLAAQQILHIYHLYVRQQHITIPLIQANIAILLDSRIIETLDTGSSGAEQHLGTMQLCQHYSSITCIVARSRVLLLVAGLVLLVNNHQSQSLHRQEYGRAHTDHQAEGLGAHLFLPELYPLGIRKLRVINAHFIAENALQPLGYLSGEGNLRQQIEHLPAFVNHFADQAYVYLGLSARRHAMKEADIMPVPFTADLVESRLLCIRQRQLIYHAARIASKASYFVVIGFHYSLGLQSGQHCGRHISLFQQPIAANLFHQLRVAHLNGCFHRSQFSQLQHQGIASRRLLQTLKEFV